MKIIVFSAEVSVLDGETVESVLQDLGGLGVRLDVWDVLERGTTSLEEGHTPE